MLKDYFLKIYTIFIKNHLIIFEKKINHYYFKLLLSEDFKRI